MDYYITEDGITFDDDVIPIEEFEFDGEFLIDLLEVIAEIDLGIS